MTAGMPAAGGGAGTRPDEPGASGEFVRALDADALALFARKGEEAGPGAPQTGLANGVKVRRVMQLTRDLAGRPFEALRILDLGCGEGVYAIEAALRGAAVVAVDARTERMALGAACAARHRLQGIRFLQEDVRRITRETHGEFDVVYLLGLLYHLDVPDAFAVLEQVSRASASTYRRAVRRVERNAPGIRSLRADPSRSNSHADSPATSRESSASRRQNAAWSEARKGRPGSCSPIAGAPGTRRVGRGRGTSRR